MKPRILAPGGMRRHASGSYLTASISTFSANGGPGRWPPGKLRFPDNDELRDLLENIAERIDGLQEAIYADQEPDLYVAPLTPLEQYEEEIIDCREWHGNAPELWKNVFRKDVDIEALAFYMLPEETRDRLTN